PVPPPRAIMPRERPSFPGQRAEGDRGVPRDRPNPWDRSLRPVPRDDQGSSARPERSRRPDYPVRREQPDRPVGPDHAPGREGRQPDRARPSPSTPQRRPEDGGAPRTRRAPAPTAPAGPRQAPRAEPSRGGQRDNGRARAAGPARPPAASA